MKKYVFIIASFLLLFLLLIFVFKTKKSIIGKWKSIDTDYEYYYIFNEDKTCSYKMKGARLDCTYEIDLEKLTILYKGSDKPRTYEYYFEKRNLIIKNDTSESYKFIKVKN